MGSSVDQACGRAGLSLADEWRLAEGQCVGSSPRPCTWIATPATLRGVSHQSDLPYSLGVYRTAHFRLHGPLVTFSGTRPDRRRDAGSRRPEKAEGHSQDGTADISLISTISCPVARVYGAEPGSA